MKHLFLAFLSLCSLLSFADTQYTNFFPTATVGGWTTNYPSAKEMADAQHIPCVLLVVGTGTYTQYGSFYNRVFCNTNFQEIISYNGYIGIYIPTTQDKWFAQRVDPEVIEVIGPGSLPRVSCYWNKVTGEVIDTKTVAITGSRIDVDYYKSYIKSHLGTYDQYASSKTNSVITVTSSIFQCGRTSIECTHPANMTEGDTAILTFNRLSDHVEAITFHVLTNGLWCANISWAEGDRSTKTLAIPTGITPEFDDGRTLSITIKSLNGVVYEQ